MVLSISSCAYIETMRYMHFICAVSGLKLKTLTNKKLQAVKEVYDIDVVDDHIALACGEEGIICCQMSFDAVVL